MGGWNCNRRLLAGFVCYWLGICPLGISADDRIAEPEEYVPPFVQLAEDAPAVLWDAVEVSDFQLVDQAGEPVTKERLKGKPWVANFVFTRCIVQCPANCKKIREINNLVRDVDVRFVTITVDPEHDDVARMAEYANIYSPDEPDRWLFCTGEPAAVWDLIRKGFKVSAWEEVGSRRLPGMEFAHSNHLVHVDANGRILGRYNAVSDEEITTLTQVLKGKIPTPLKHQPANIALMEAQRAKLLEEAAEAREQHAADPLANLPDWARRLPATNAMLNGLATMLLLLGFVAIKAGQRRLHRQLMLTAFAVSVLFLASYLTYHGALSAYTDSHGKRYAGPPEYATLYYGILISHVVLAALVPIGAIGSIWNALREKWPAHRRWAKITYPIWLYVSVTGVVIYWMLYQM